VAGNANFLVLVHGRASPYFCLSAPKQNNRQKFGMGSLLQTTDLFIIELHVGNT
jgi:hypothetical protein